MRGTIYRRMPGGSWYFGVDVGNDPRTGRRRFKTKGGFATRKDAQRALAEVIADVNRGTFSEPTTQTVCEFLREWLAGGPSRGLRTSTLVGYEVAIEQWIIPRLDAVPLARLGPADLNGLYSVLLVEGRTQRKGGLSPRTTRMCHTVIRRALRDAVRWGKLPRNVADLADPPSTASTKAEARKKMRPWTTEELRHFLAHSRDDRLRAAFVLAATTGLRRGEVLGLRWQDVDVENKRLRVVQTLVAPRYELRIEAPKTDAGRRSVALDEVTLAGLREHRKRQTEERLAFGPGWGTLPFAEDLCFTEPDGGPIKPALFLLRFQQAAKRAGLWKIRLHDLRHGHVTALMEAGVPLPVIAQRVGHSSVAVTGDTYSRVRQELRDDTAALGAALLFGPSVATEAQS